MYCVRGIDLWIHSFDPVTLSVGVPWLLTSKTLTQEVFPDDQATGDWPSDGK